MADLTAIGLPIDAVLAEIATALEKWKAQHTPERIKEVVHSKLDKGTEHILLKLLGFETGYNGQWQVDHCNGRSGNSAVGDYLRETQKEAIQEWFNRIKLPTLTSTTQKSLGKAYRDEYLRNLQYRVQEEARAHAKRDLEQLLDKLSSSNQIQNYLKTLELLSSKSDSST